MGKIKTILILILAGLTIYQTGILWFVNITGFGFLASYLPFLRQISVPYGVEYLIVPNRIITAHENGTFTAQYSNITESAEWQYSNRIITHLMQNGIFEDVQPTDYNTLFAENLPFYVYDYAFPMLADWFSMAFFPNDTILNIPESFNRVIIYPPLNGETAATVIFLSVDGFSYKFSVAPNEEDSANFDHEIISYRSNFVNYNFANGVFSRIDGFYGVEISHPYADNIGFSLSGVQDRISVFFRNPAAIRTIVRDGTWVYRDINTVVLYHDTNILEYINYRAIDRSNPATFLESYSAAIQFVLQDNLITNEVTLSLFTQEDEIFTFYFDFVVDNTPIILPNNWPTADPLQHAVIVTVDHGTVVRYRKLAINFQQNPNLTLQTTTALQNHIAQILGAR
ncbi:MAG: hypothetical protein FWG64_05345 [Firmicutes bacterium]|nr:hypothetical protein [Bacillota bacterium]